jgi:glycosyltransferase involved in cell wall biosynthesis
MNPLRIGIVGGIYDRSDEYRKKRQLTPETILAQGLEARGVEVVECGHHRFDPSGAFDLVHVHHLGRGALVMASAPPGARFVFTSHDPRLMNGYQVSWRRLTAFRFVVRRADAVVALSDAELQYTCDTVPASAEKSVVIANGFPGDVFSYVPRAPRIASNGSGPSFKLLFVGQLIPMKGVDVLLHALETLAPRLKFSLQLVYQNTQMESAYRELAARIGLADRVEFLGLKSAAELAELYRAADLFILPSRGEALPCVINEAMMCGLPVVATRVGGIVDQVGPHGYLVEPDDPAALAATISRALADIDQGKIANAEISRYATERFSIAAMVEGHLTLYRRLLEQAKPLERSRVGLQAANLGASFLLNTVGNRLAGKGLLTG